MIIFVASALFKKVSLLDAFYKGVKEAMMFVKTLFPSLLAFMLMVCLLESSGIIGFITLQLKNCLPFELPSSILGLALLRPVSSSASLAFLTDIFNTYGPDSFFGLMASLMQGATDTTLYVISVYFSQTHVTKSGYILLLCLCLDALALILAVILTFIAF